MSYTGLEPTGNYVNAPARFTIETFSAGRGEVEVVVINPKGQREPVRSRTRIIAKYIKRD